MVWIHPSLINQNASSTFRASEQTANTNAHWVQNIREVAFLFLQSIYLRNILQYFITKEIEIWREIENMVHNGRILY